MRKWPPRIEALRKWATWESKDIPVNLVLAIINHESGGISGIQSTRKNKAYQVKNDAGELVTMDHALGLMQCSPSLLKTWQDSGKKPFITVDDLKQKDERGSRCQITLGCWYFAICVKHLHQYDPKTFSGSSPGSASNEQLKLALMCYAVGWGGKSGPGGRGLKPKLDALRKAGEPLTAQSIKKSFPAFAQPQNNPLHFSKSIWAAYQEVGGEEPPSAQPKQGEPSTELAILDKPKKLGKDLFGDYWPLVLIGLIWMIQKNGGLKGILSHGSEEEEETDDEEKIAS